MAAVPFGILRGSRRGQRPPRCVVVKQPPSQTFNLGYDAFLFSYCKLPRSGHNEPGAPVRSSSKRIASKLASLNGTAHFGIIFYSFDFGYFGSAWLCRRRRSFGSVPPIKSRLHVHWHEFINLVDFHGTSCMSRQSLAVALAFDACFTGIVHSFVASNTRGTYSTYKRRCRKYNTRLCA